jgi:hypothetical protein
MESKGLYPKSEYLQAIPFWILELRIWYLVFEK